MQTQDGIGQHRRFVRVLGIRRASFVEFSFALGDPELAVELVLPFAAFVELCDRYHVETIEPEPEVAIAFEALARRTHR
jgi:phenol/toluene 2-monooxygenase (NADH) P0/A0